MYSRDLLPPNELLLNWLLAAAAATAPIATWFLLPPPPPPPPPPPVPFGGGSSGGLMYCDCPPLVGIPPMGAGEHRSNFMEVSTTVFLFQSRLG